MDAALRPLDQIAGQDWANGVSILVLVDAALRLSDRRFSMLPMFVSILVLVDAALRHLLSLPAAWTHRQFQSLF